MAIYNEARRDLPFEDGADAAAVRRGRRATNDSLKVQAADGATVWDLEPYEFLRGSNTGAVHPSLWRISNLNVQHGLFEVTSNVWQVRGYDVSNVTFIRGNKGLIVVDPLTSVETARAALALARSEIGNLPVSGVIYTHGHVDHFAGVCGLWSDSDQRTDVPIVAPAGFLQSAISENVYAGNAMSRRAEYMWGTALSPGLLGQVGGGLGTATPRGEQTLLVPTVYIQSDREVRTIDGVEFEFILTPDAEAPSEMVFFLPESRALCMSEIASHVMHNLYTLRGAQVRDALAWSRYLQEAADRYGSQCDVMFNSHHWPTWGSGEVTELLTKQASLYRYLHDETLRLANHGYGPDEIAEMVTLPASLRHYWPNRGTYGTVKHNVRAVYQRYLGWFDGNPARLDPLPRSAAALKYVELAGGVDGVLRSARRAFAGGEYRWAAELLDHAMAVAPEMNALRELQADTLEQLGFQAESGVWRNFYLMGAKELRDGVDKSAAMRTDSPGVVAAMPVDMVLDYLAIRLNGSRAENASGTFGVHVIDLDEWVLVELEHGVLRYREVDPDALAGSTIIGIASDQLGLLASATNLDGLTLETTEGLAEAEVVFSYLDVFDPKFAVVTQVLPSPVQGG